MLFCFQHFSVLTKFDFLGGGWGLGSLYVFAACHLGLAMTKVRRCKLPYNSNMPCSKNVVLVCINQFSYVKIYLENLYIYINIFDFFLIFLYYDMDCIIIILMRLVKIEFTYVK